MLIGYVTVRLIGLDKIILVTETVIKLIFLFLCEQGPFQKYRDLMEEENPLVRSRPLKKTGWFCAYNSICSCAVLLRLLLTN